MKFNCKACQTYVETTFSKHLLCKDCLYVQIKENARQKTAYWAMIDSIIDDPVGHGNSNLEPINDGNEWSPQLFKHSRYV